MVTQQKGKGFTIIEVVLVLAIAGLIFLMVLIALPALQRSQRDNQRRQDVSKFMSQLTSYSTNNKGAVPALDTTATRTDFLNNYLKQNAGEFKDPRSGVNYTINQTNPTTTDTVTRLQYVTGQKCNGESLVSASARSAAVRVQLEGAGIYCQDNQ